MQEAMCTAADIVIRKISGTSLSRIHGLRDLPDIPGIVGALQPKELASIFGSPGLVSRGIRRVESQEIIAGAYAFQVHPALYFTHGGFFPRRKCKNHQFTPFFGAQALAAPIH